MRKRRGRGKWLRQFDAIRDDLCVEAPPPGARVFDYGCGAGQDLDVLQDCGWDTWGLETAVDDAFTGIGGCTPCLMSRYSIWSSSTMYWST